MSYGLEITNTKDHPQITAKSILLGVHSEFTMHAETTRTIPEGALVFLSHNADGYKEFTYPEQEKSLGGFSIIQTGNVIKLESRSAQGYSNFGSCDVMVALPMNKLKECDLEYGFVVYTETGERSYSLGNRSLEIIELTTLPSTGDLEWNSKFTALTSYERLWFRAEGVGQAWQISDQTMAVNGGSLGPFYKMSRLLTLPAPNTARMSCFFDIAGYTSLGYFSPKMEDTLSDMFVKALNGSPQSVNNPYAAEQTPLKPPSIMVVKTVADVSQVPGAAGVLPGSVLKGHSQVEFTVVCSTAGEAACASITTVISGGKFKDNTTTKTLGNYSVAKITAASSSSVTISTTAINPRGSSPVTTTTIELLTAVKPLKPVMSLTSTTASTITIEFPVVNAYTENAPDIWEISYNIEGGTPVTFQESFDTYNVTIRGLTPATTYIVSVVGKNPAGIGPSNSAPISTKGLI
jgi:hypothetical protein